MLKRPTLAILILLGLIPAAWGQVQITVYNKDLALVKDTRPLEFERGVFELAFTDVAAAIDPTSVAFKVLDHADAVSLLEQNFRYDLVSSEKVLQKYIDQTVRVITRQDKVHEGTLLSADAHSLMLRSLNGSLTIVNREQIADVSLAMLPEGLITRPTLVWTLESDVAGPLDTEVRYLTGKIGWHAEYVATISADETELDLAGWVSIDNRSGVTYDDATIKLIAGDVHRVQDQRRVREDFLAVTMAKSRASGFEEKAFFEYHLYTLRRRSTIRNNEIKQLSLFEPARATARKVFTYDGARDEKKVRVMMEFQNSAAAGLGMALPMGKIRVMKSDSDGSLEFIGEDRIDHTPKDETVRIRLGNAFDVVGERVNKEHRQISPRTTEDDFEVTLRNHKDTDITVTVIEHVYGDWSVLRSTLKHNKKDANTAEWTVPVPADGEALLTYTIRRGY